MKKLLLSLFAGFVGIISFCSAGTVHYEGDVDFDFGTKSSNNFIYFTIPYNSAPISDPSLNLSCNISNYTGTDGVAYRFRVRLYYGNASSPTSSSTYMNVGYISDFVNGNYYFSQSLSYYGETISLFALNYNVEGTTYSYAGSFHYSCDLSGDKIIGGSSSCDPQYTSLECQSEYNLIPVEDVDINYCVGNGLCPNECGSGTDLSGDLQYSNIYINSILHPGEENIFIDIPDYIQWDYSVDTGNFNIYVGSGYDMDYMNSIIKINSYRPTSSDFTNIFVSGLTLIFPYIFVLLLIVFIWKLIKRVFK